MPVLTTTRREGPPDNHCVLRVSLNNKIKEIHGSRPAEVIGVTTLRTAEPRVSAGGQEGMRAFLEKRKPKWVP